MIAPVSMAPTAAPIGAPSQEVSKADKKDRRKLELDVDSYVHGNEESQEANKTAVYDRTGKRKQMKTSR